MFPLFLALTVVSLVALIVGAILLLLRRRTLVARQVGPEAGAQVMHNSAMPLPDDHTVAETRASAFIGTGASLHVEAEISFADGKQAWRERNWGDVLLVALLSFSFIGVFLFGALSLLTGLDDKLLGIIALVLAIWLIVRMGRDFLKA